MVNPVLKRALETWGEQAQMLMVVEEMSELMKEVLKNINRKKNNIAEIIEETADALVKTGLADAGYKYINLDDCWQSSLRTADGKLQGDLTRFPKGIKPLVAMYLEMVLLIMAYP